jgi:hypothetical protein
MTRSPREVAVPAAALARLRTALQGEAGELPTVHALHAAGFDAGAPLFDAFVRGLADGLDSVPRDAFWSHVERFFRERGWGSLRHDDGHPAVGFLHAPDWAEASDGGDDQPSCAFGAGMLSQFLTRVAGGPVAVLETSCRSSGASHCTFAFGSEAAIHTFYGHLVEGLSVADALDRLSG